MSQAISLWNLHSIKLTKITKAIFQKLSFHLWSSTPPWHSNLYTTYLLPPPFFLSLFSVLFKPGVEQWILLKGESLIPISFSTVLFLFRIKGENLELILLQELKAGGGGKILISTANRLAWLNARVVLVLMSSQYSFGSSFWLKKKTP